MRQSTPNAPDGHQIPCTMKYMDDLQQPKLLKPTLQQLQENLAQILVNGSLYNRFQYDGSGEGIHFVNTTAVNRPHYSFLPEQIRMYCGNKNCRQETIWQTDDAQVYFGLDRFHHAKYTCRNCGSNSQNYWFRWTKGESLTSMFMKVGQFPALSIEPQKELANALGKEDAELYKKSLINANFSFGLGALAYFRRVIENKVSMLLDLIAEAAKLANFEPEELARIDEIKNSHHLDVKIEYASKILPPNLRPGGHNPLNKLYAIASTGIHGKSDQECLDDFNSARFEFEYLFKNLTISNEEAKAYLERVSSSPKKS